MKPAQLDKWLEKWGGVIMFGIVIGLILYGTFAKPGKTAARTPCNQVCQDKADVEAEYYWGK